MGTPPVTRRAGTQCTTATVVLRVQQSHCTSGDLGLSSPTARRLSSRLASSLGGAARLKDLPPSLFFTSPLSSSDRVTIGQELTWGQAGPCPRRGAALSKMSIKV